MELRPIRIQSTLDSAYWGIIAAFSLIWIAVAALGAPKLGGTDVFVYKDAGCNLALGEGFISSGLPGTADLDPHLFASSAPGVPFLFGLFAKMFGCNGRADTFFELLFASLATFSVAWVLQSTFSSNQKLLAAAAMGSVIPSGLVSAETDRPDMPSFGIFVIACILARSRSPRCRFIIAPLLAGLCGLMFPFGGLLAVLAVWSIALTPLLEAPTKGSFWPRSVSLSLQQGILFACPIVAVVFLYGFLDPSATVRFAGNAFGSNSGMGSVFHNGYRVLLHDAIFSSGPYSLSLMISWAIVVCIVSYFIITYLIKNRQVENWIIATVLITFMLIPVLLFPKQNNYMAWARTGLLVLLAASTASMAKDACRRQVVTTSLFIVVCANVPFVWLSGLEQLQSEESYETASSEVSLFARALGDIPNNQFVIIPSSVYFLYKKEIHRVADEYYASALVTPPRIAGAALCYQNVKPGERIAPTRNYLPPLVLFSRASTHYLPSLLGLPLSHHEWGWSCDNYIASPHFSLCHKVRNAG